MSTSKSKKVKKKVFPKRNKTTKESLSNPLVEGRWDESEDELLLNTNSNVVAALLLNRSIRSANSRRYILVNKLNRTSVSVERISIRQAKKIVSKMLKDKKIMENQSNTSSSMVPMVVKNEEAHVMESTTAMEIPNSSIMLMVNNQEMFFKKGFNKLTIKGENISFSIE